MPQPETMKAIIEQAQKYGNFGFWELDLLNNELTWSYQVYVMFGKPKKSFIPTLERFLETVHPEDREMVENAYTLSLQERTQYAIEHRILLDDGTVRYVSEHCETIYDNDGTPMRSLGVVQDITERAEALRKLKDSEEKFRAISKQTTEGITVADMDGNYVYVNPAFCEMSGYTEDELLNMTVFDMKAPDQDHSSFKDSKTKMQGKAMRVNLQKKDGTVYYTEIIGDILQLDEMQLVLGTIRDISERVKYENEIIELNENLELTVVERTKELKETVEELNEEIIRRNTIEEKLKESLEIKEILLKEITHRVKNNMQIISSLINLQQVNLPEGSYDFLDQIKHRIHSMALIHETLYKTDEFKQVKFQNYTESLLRYLKDSFVHEEIEIVSNVTNISLPLDIATNCGMIMMELITNAIKYAFQDRDKGIIRVNFREKDRNKFELTVADNGIGFPKDIDFTRSQSLGLQLVTSLTAQMDGMIKQSVENGTEYTITFSVPN